MASAVVVGALISYFGLMAVQAAYGDKKSIERNHEYIPADKEPDKTFNQPAANLPEKKKPRLLTKREFSDMETYLLNLRRAAERDYPELCEVKPSGRGVSGMALPQRYPETICLARTSRRLYAKGGDIQYLELAVYYYRRCLYFIDGQLQGSFKKPKGGDNQIRQRQKEVYMELDELESSGD